MTIKSLTLIVFWFVLILFPIYNTYGILDGVNMKFFVLSGVNFIVLVITALYLVFRLFYFKLDKVNFLILFLTLIAVSSSLLMSFSSRFIDSYLYIFSPFFAYVFLSKSIIDFNKSLIVLNTLFVLSVVLSLVTIDSFQNIFRVSDINTFSSIFPGTGMVTSYY